MLTHLVFCHFARDHQLSTSRPDFELFRYLLDNYIISEVEHQSLLGVKSLLKAPFGRGPASNGSVGQYEGRRSRSLSRPQHHQPRRLSAPAVVREHYETNAGVCFNGSQRSDFADSCVLLDLQECDHSLLSLAALAVSKRLPEKSDDGLDMHSEISTSDMEGPENEEMWETDSTLLKENRTGPLFDWINDGSGYSHFQNMACVQNRNVTETDPGSLLRSDINQSQFYNVKRYLTTCLMAEIYSLCSRRLSGIRSCTNSSSDGVGQAPTANESGSRGFQTPRHRPSTKRRKAPTDDGEDDQRREQKKPANSHSRVKNSRRFACPFYQHDPSQYSPMARGAAFRTCAGPGFATIGRMKEHLYRAHMAPPHCPRCQNVFENSDQLAQHLNAVARCEQASMISVEGISQTQAQRLRSKKKTSPDQTDIERWQEVYRLIFPNEHSVPSPHYVEDVKFIPFSQMYLPRILERELGRAFAQQPLALTAANEAGISSVVNRSLSALMQEYRLQQSGTEETMVPEVYRPSEDGQMRHLYRTEREDGNTQHVSDDSNHVQDHQNILDNRVPIFAEPSLDNFDHSQAPFLVDADGSDGNQYQLYPELSSDFITESLFNNAPEIFGIPPKSQNPLGVELPSLYIEELEW